MFEVLLSQSAREFTAHDGIMNPEYDVESIQNPKS
jgi:hypothetical protein